MGNKKILVSACLYGYCTAYDGKNRILTDKKFLQWKNRGMLVPICPEALGGLSIPRPPSEICGKRVLSKDGQDVTENYENGAAAVLDIAKKNGVLFAIMKDGSPSCGCKHIYDGTFSGKKISGSGICAQMLIQNGIPVFAEDDLTLAEVLLNEK